MFDHIASNAGTQAVFIVALAVVIVTLIITKSMKQFDQRQKEYDVVQRNESRQTSKLPAPIDHSPAPSDF